MSDKPKHEAHIFYPDTRFERMARRPGGVAREQALANAQTKVEELAPDFAAWLDAALQELKDALSSLADNPKSPAAIERADNACSQLRDIGATMGYNLVTFVANSLCTILEAIQAGASYDKDIIDCHINALFLVRTEPYRNLTPDQVPEMSKGLLRVVEIAGISPYREDE